MGDLDSEKIKEPGKHLGEGGEGLSFLLCSGFLL